MKFYAMYNAYGIMTGGLAVDTFRAFPSRKTRDKFVASHYWDGSNVIWREATRAEVVKKYGRDFSVNPSGWISYGPRDIG